MSTRKLHIAVNPEREIVVSPSEELVKAFVKKKGRMGEFAIVCYSHGNSGRQIHITHGENLVNAPTVNHLIENMFSRAIQGLPEDEPAVIPASKNDRHGSVTAFQRVKFKIIRENPPGTLRLVNITYDDLIKEITAAAA